VPFFRSRPSLALAATSVLCVLVGVALPFSPLKGVLGFTPLPLGFLGILGVMIVTYLGLVEAGKSYFFRSEIKVAPLAKPRSATQRRIIRLMPRWTHTRRAG
jgi:Mg2+-importing ATPase